MFADAVRAAVMAVRGNVQTDRRRQYVAPARAVGSAA